ncbi:hypothetical protein PV10_03625 [Exophiala mesophila]|uniref:Sulfite efflux pump SSU1 n=1 Tax=Exophiala mesophila TaxID=212818 RepID=A0A0D2AAW9_EXOME|nr:uncharacterized protein PV10_03625 [Exophiala mesophila]KIV96043.1 hypothetical protein PV10_03625 [Exophiala mesophila]
MAVGDGDPELQKLASNNPAMTIPATVDSQPEFQQLRSRLAPSDASDTTSTQPPQDMAGDMAGDMGNGPLNTISSTISQPTKYDRGWRRVVRNFSPSWFSVTMGTGVVSILLITIPFKATWLYWLSVIFFILNTVLFSLAFLASFLRYTLYPEIWYVMIADGTNSLFLATIPMGFATLINAWIFLCCPYWGYWSVTFAWVCWMIDAIVAAAVTVSLPFLLMRQRERHDLDRITAAQLLPIAATIVASAVGAETARVLTHSPQAALGTLLTSYVMWGMATPFALTILVIYYQRLALHKLPPREVVVSSFLPLGPLGMGGNAIMHLGKVARDLFLRVGFLHNLSMAGDIVYVMGIFVALIMWGFGLCWLVFALATIYQTRPFPFNMGWWGFTFPLGVYAVSTITFGVEMPSLFFRVLGTIFAVAVILLWCVVAFGTAKGAWSGKLFYAPCLKNLKKEDQKPQNHSRSQAEKREDSSV